jgi:hypothetical protein
MRFYCTHQHHLLHLHNIIYYISTLREKIHADRPFRRQTRQPGAPISSSPARHLHNSAATAVSLWAPPIHTHARLCANPLQSGNPACFCARHFSWLHQLSRVPITTSSYQKPRRARGGGASDNLGFIHSHVNVRLMRILDTTAAASPPPSRTTSPTHFIPSLV